MPQTQFEISQTLGDLGQLAPAGYALGLHIEYTTPMYMFQSYPKVWLDYYSQNGLVMSDPMVAWGFENTGSARWSDLEDPTGVLVKAASYGLSYGLVSATKSEDSLSICGFARNDREFSDSEIAIISEKIAFLHRSTANHAELTPETVKQLKKMSIMVTHPGA